MALIYIVEDDQNIREIESFALKNSGYTIMDFECAKDFYHKLAEKVPDCILLDIMLPDGWSGDSEKDKIDSGYQKGSDYDDYGQDHRA